MEKASIPSLLYDDQHVLDFIDVHLFMYFLSIFIIYIYPYYLDLTLACPESL